MNTKKNTFAIPFATLFNGIKTHVYRYGILGKGGTKAGIVNNRDGRIGGMLGAGNNTEIAIEIFSDPFAQSCFDRLMEVASYAILNVEPFSTTQIDIDAAEFIEEEYLKVHRETIFESLALAKITGCAAHENNYGINNSNKIVVKSITPVDSERLIYAAKENVAEADLRIMTFNQPFSGEEPPGRKIVDYKYYSIFVNNPYGFGVGSQLIDLVRYKQRMLPLWVKIAERFSTPIKIGKMPDTASSQEIDEFFNHFIDMSENAVFMLPPGFDMSIVDISASGADSLLKSLIDYCDAQISTLILGEHLTGREIANGAQARDAIASSITERKALSLLNSIVGRLNTTTITWLTQWNFAGANPPKVFFTYEQSKQKLGDRLEQAKRLGIPLDLEKCAEMLDVPYSNDPTLGLGDRPGRDFQLP